MEHLGAPKSVQSRHSDNQQGSIHAKTVVSLLGKRPHAEFMRELQVELGLAPTTKAPNPKTASGSYQQQPTTWQQKPKTRPRGLPAGPPSFATPEWSPHNCRPQSVEGLQRG